MGTPATYEGGHVVDTEGPRLPCSLSQGFFSFEAQIEEVVSKQHTNRGERLEFIRNMMTEANRRAGAVVVQLKPHAWSVRCLTITPALLVERF